MCPQAAAAGAVSHHGPDPALPEEVLAWVEVFLHSLSVSGNRAGPRHAPNFASLSNHLVFLESVTSIASPFGERGEQQATKPKLQLLSLDNKPILVT